MQVGDIVLLFDHLYWMRDRILTAAEKVPDAFVDGEGVTIRDLRSTLVHELDVEWSWRERLRGTPFETWGPDGELKPAAYDTLSSLAEHWRRDEADMRGWLGELTDHQLNAPWEVEGPGGHLLWYHLMHPSSTVNSSATPQ